MGGPFSVDEARDGKRGDLPAQAALRRAALGGLVRATRFGARLTPIAHPPIGRTGDCI